MMLRSSLCNIFQAAYLLVVLTLCLLGNTAVIGTVWLDERLHEPPNLLLSGLCVADILYDLLVVPVMLSEYYVIILFHQCGY